MILIKTTGESGGVTPYIDTFLDGEVSGQL